MPKGVYSRPARMDLSGLKYGSLQVLRADSTKKYYWVCQCDCGNILPVAGGDLRRPRPPRHCKLCKPPPPVNITHHLTKSPEYKAWVSMISRCTRPTHLAYGKYGARGIRVCTQWIGPGGFDVFLKEIGFKPSKELTLDRIDSSKGYEPGNVRWATMHTQSRNKSNNKFLTYEGRTMVIADWAIESGISRDTLDYRIKAGWPMEKIFRCGTFR